MKRRLLILLLTPIFLLYGCSKKSDILPDNIIQNFYSSTHQIKSQMHLISDDVSALLEAYIDAAGSGTGLLSVGNIIYETIFINNDMYVTVLDNNYCIENLGYHLSFDKLDLTDMTTEEILAKGFVFNDTDITSFHSTIDGVQFENQYTESNKIIEPSVSTKDIIIPLNDFLRLLSKVNSVKSNDVNVIGKIAVENAEKEKSEIEENAEEKKSYYINSNLGITVNGQIFSINDYINIKDYFFNTTPEGINYKDEWDKDDKIVLCYASYIDTTGKFTAMSIHNIVYKLAVDCDFKFLGFTSGQELKEVSKILGVKLTNKEKKEFKPIREDITITKTGTDFICFTVDKYNVRFGFDKLKKLSSMTIEKEREYKKYEN